MRFELNIDCTNAAFGEDMLDTQAEVGRILLKIGAALMRHEAGTDQAWSIRDLCGNKVGQYSFKEAKT